MLQTLPQVGAFSDGVLEAHGTLETTFVMCLRTSSPFRFRMSILGLEQYGGIMSLAQRFRPHPEVVDTELEGQQVVLLHLESMRYYSLNLTGMRIWQGLKQGLSLQEISGRLQAEFEVEADRAERSVVALVDELCQQQLVQNLA